MPRKLGLLGRGLGVFGSYAKVLLDDDEPAAYAQFGPLSAYPRAQRLRELYPQLPDAPLPAVITCIATTAEARHRGLARTLVEAVCDDLAGRGFAAVEAYPERGTRPDATSAATPEFWLGGRVPDRRRRRALPRRPARAGLDAAAARGATVARERGAADGSASRESAMAMIQALGNVSKVRGALIFVEDIEAELAFYRDVIGLRLLYRTPKFVRFDATQGTSLSLIAGGIASPEPKDFRHGGVVPEIIVDNLRLAMQRLDGAGVRHEDVVRTDWGQFCFLWDPEGNPLQFYESAFIRPDADPERVPG